MEISTYKDKPTPSLSEDLWKGTAPKKGKPVFEREYISDQRMQTIVQFFSSNYIPPRPETTSVKKEG